MATNRLNFDPSPPPPPLTRPMAGGFWLGLISFVVGLTLIAPPLSVLYEANDESARTTQGVTEPGVWATLFRIPPLSVDRGAYRALRTTVIAAALNAVVFAGIGLLTMRNRSLGARLLGACAVAHVIFMIAMIVTARHFSAALNAATAGQPWYFGTPYGSAVGSTGTWAALPGIVYPVVLLWLFARHRRASRAIRPM